mgnify:CR=1 FL=1
MATITGGKVLIKFINIFMIKAIVLLEVTVRIAFAPSPPFGVLGLYLKGT